MRARSPPERTSSATTATVAMMISSHTTHIQPMPMPIPHPLPYIPSPSGRGGVGRSVGQLLPGGVTGPGSCPSCPGPRGPGCGSGRRSAHRSRRT
ncbi:hypothetical protein [Ornithinimicrobium kibberense]|uniref:hypothetical protein n=1 Tax=Ornithinimicrobium kibberense TaxID=282060 RepID=UPI00361D7F44